MIIRNIVKLIILSLFTYLPATAFANATLYEHCGYKGSRATLAPGKYDLKDLKHRGIDNISSLKVAKGFEIIVYERHHFSGRRLKFRSNDTCLVNNKFNDRISSIRIRKVSNPKRAVIYQHCNYKGYRVALAVGNYDLKQLRRMGIKNDDLSSLKVTPGYEVIVYQHQHFAGRRWKFKYNDSCLANNNFNDIISSIRVRRVRR